MRGAIVSLLAISCSGNMVFAAESSEWRGLAPDCWTVDRQYHVDGLAHWQEQPTDLQLTFASVEVMPDGERLLSPNQGYYIVSQSGAGYSSITIDAEQGHFWELYATGNNGGYPSFATVEWVSEKVLFTRIWWGRVAFDDLLLDVEKETVLYTERGLDGYLARQQGRDTCGHTVDCECIKRDGLGQE